MKNIIIWAVALSWTLLGMLLFFSVNIAANVGVADVLAAAPFYKAAIMVFLFGPMVWFAMSVVFLCKSLFSIIPNELVVWLLY